LPVKVLRLFSSMFLFSFFEKQNKDKPSIQDS